MMGDREKCIQAQMDEYLSKPLQQNQLIQTILKCATLGGPLLEKHRERELALQERVKSSSLKDGSKSIARPALEIRSLTTRETLFNPAADSSGLSSIDQQDAIANSRRDLAEMRSLSS